MKRKMFVTICAAAVFNLSVLTADVASAVVSTAVQEYKAKNFSHLLDMRGFTKEQLELHFKLYEGYVKNTNLLQQKLSAFYQSGQDKGPEYAGLKRMYGWEFDGMRLHELYFGSLGGNGQPNTGSQLYQAIVQTFGSYEAWQKDFAATGLIRGIGWAVLYRDPDTGALVNSWINEHDIGHLAGAAPLLIMDVFEHAYVTEYGLDRSKYIDAFFANVDWRVVDDRFSKSK